MSRWITLALGVVVIVGNLAAVALLGDAPSAYKIEQVDTWFTQALAAPDAAVASAWAFTVGVGAMIPFAVLVASMIDEPRPRLAYVGSALVATGALLNAAGTLFPAVVVTQLADAPRVGAAFLAIAIDLDAAFNLFLGLGLVAFGVASWRAWPRWLSILGVVAGLASLPVAGQAFDDDFARLLAISGPLWLAWILAVSIRSTKRTAWN